MSSKVYIAGIGALTAAGYNAQMVFDAVKAGLNLFQDSGYVNRHFMPVKMGLVPHDALPAITDAIQFYGDYSRWHQQLLQLAHAPVLEALQNYTEDAPLPIILSCPEYYPQWPHQLPADFIENLSKQCGVEFCLHRRRSLHIGRAGVIEAIDIAQRMFDDTDTSYVLVGGIDSYQRPELLHGLLTEERINSEQVMDGFTPAEGACFLLLSNDPDSALGNNRYRIRLGKPGIGQEAGHLYSDDPYLGDGLAQAVSTALASYQGLAIDRIYSSMNGENYWSRELGVAISRHNQHLSDEYRVEHPADCYGDLGAASTAMLIAISSLALATHSSSAIHLILGSSDQSYRGALTVITEAIAQEPAA